MRNVDFIQDKDLKKLMKEFIFSFKNYEINKKPFISSFLNPNEITLAETFDSIGILKSFGGGEFTERKVLFTPEFSMENVLDIFTFEVDNAFVKHRDVLGALLSNGLKRSEIGDIIFGDNVCEFALTLGHEEKVFNLTSIKNINVIIQKKKDNHFVNPITFDEEFRASISSLRIDVFVAEAVRSSRSKSQNMIKAGKIKLNHVINKNIDAKISIKDTISISGVGRFVIKEFDGISKKGRNYIKYIKKG